MAAYAALVSLMQILKQIHHHPRPPISLDGQQALSLSENLTFLQQFLEAYNFYKDADGGEADGLDSRIADAAYAAEDIIESHVVDQILAPSSTPHDDEIRSGLEKVIVDMDLIKKDVTKIKEKMGASNSFIYSGGGGSSRFASTWRTSTVVGFDEVMYEVMDKLTGGNPGRGIIPIVGMGGIGKTTLARSVYENQVVVQHFDVLAWVTVSQEYRMMDILLELLEEDKEGDSSRINEYELREKMHKKLSGRRYLIILDDIWGVEVWDKLKFFFPDNGNGSRIMVTTRLSNLASEVANCGGIEMQFLDEVTSWDLFCKNVFEKEGCCPLELEKIGRKIVKSCKGLPLSINVIGGLLAKSAQTRENWEHIGENLNAIVNLEENEHCLQVLYLSYNNLPVYLKPCFLYMGVFPEDFEVDVSKLVKVWIAEGFLKPIDGKTWEEIAQEFLEELIDRNLILVGKFNYLGKLKSCKIHDLLRDLCLREARKQKFLSVFRVESCPPDIPQDINRRVSILCSSHLEKWPPQLVHAMESSSSLARSLIWEYMQPELAEFGFRLLRVRYPIVGFSNNHHLQLIFKKVNLRYVDGGFDYNLTTFPSTFSLLWNLQTMIFSHIKIGSAPSDIWKMPQLRHVKIWSPLQLPDPDTDGIVLENLQKLAFINKFKCSEEVVKRIPNIKELAIAYWGDDEGSSCYNFNNLPLLHKLESLWLALQRSPTLDSLQRQVVEDLAFPHSLKKLTLKWTLLDWEDVTEKIGSLPCLQVLKLQNEAAIGPEWTTIEGHFPKLKLLEIDGSDLECWTSESSDFPCLEHLVLGFLKDLVEIPSGIGDIATLKTIQVEDTCSESAIESAKSIEMEQEEVGNEGLRVCIFPLDRKWVRGDMRMIFLKESAVENASTEATTGSEISEDSEGAVDEDD